MELSFQEFSFMYFSSKMATPSASFSFGSFFFDLDIVIISYIFLSSLCFPWGWNVWFLPFAFPLFPLYLGITKKLCIFFWIWIGLSFLIFYLVSCVFLGHGMYDFYPLRFLYFLSMVVRAICSMDYPCFYCPCLPTELPAEEPRWNTILQFGNLSPLQLSVDRILKSKNDEDSFRSLLSMIKQFSPFLGPFHNSLFPAFLLRFVKLRPRSLPPPLCS